MLSFTFSCYTDAKQVAKNTFEIQQNKVKYDQNFLSFYVIIAFDLFAAKKSRTEV